MLGLGMFDDGALGPLTEAQREVVRAMVADVARLSMLVDRELKIGRLMSDAGLDKSTSVELTGLVRPPAPTEPHGATVVVQTQDGAVVVLDAVKLLWMAASLLETVLRRPPTDAAAAAAARSRAEELSTRAIDVTGVLTTASTAATSGSLPAAELSENLPPHPDASRTMLTAAVRERREGRPSVASTTLDRVGRDVPKPLRVCTLVASFTGFRMEQGNASRLVVALEVLSWAVGQGATIVAFPAGFLRARSERIDDVLGVGDGLVSAAERTGVAMLVGVDACPPDWEDGPPRDAVVALGALPYFAVARSTPASTTVVLRQRSTSRTNWRTAPATLNDSVYGITAGSAAVALILSGEAFNVRVLKALEAARPKLAVVAAHWAGKGPRQSWMLDIPDKETIPVVRSLHARAGAENMLWKGRTKLPPIVGGVRFRDAGFEVNAAVFDV
jgi:hypothetical protein